MLTPPTDAALIERSLTEPEAFATIFDRHVRPIHAYLSRRAGPDAADELVGEVFRIAFEIRARYDTTRAESLPWLYGIAGNALRQRRRTDARQIRVANRVGGLRPTVDVEPTARIEARDDAGEVLRAIDALPPLDRETVLLYAWEGLTYQQIAIALDVPLGTVRSRLSRARERIREHVSRHGQEPGDTHARAERRCRS